MGIKWTGALSLLDLRLHYDAVRKALMKRFVYIEIFANPFSDPW